MRVAALAVVSLTLAAACSNSSNGTGKDPGKSSGGNGAVFDQATLNQPQQEGKPRKGGSLTFGLESNVSTLIPGDLQQPADLTVALAAYDPMIGFDDKGELTANGLATSMKPNADLTEWTFGLRTGISFSDGEPFNAAAVVAQFTAEKGRPKCICQTDLNNITSVSAIDEHTVRFTLKSPNVAFPLVLAGSTGWIASPKAWAKGESYLQTHPTGTGPFILTDYDTLTFKRNPNYWRTAADGTKLPYMDQVKFTPYPDTNTRLQAIRSGDVQMIQSADTGNLVDAAKDSKLVVQPVTGASSTILLLNSHKPPFDDLRARQAFNYGIDRDAINQQGYQGARVPAYGPLDPTNPYYDADPDAQLPHHDADKARSLINELKADHKSVSFEAMCIATPEASRIFQIISQQLRPLGFDSKQVQLDQAIYVQRMFSLQGDFQEACFRSGMVPDPDNLYAGLHTGGGTNIGLYSNPKVDAALEAGRGTADTTERHKQYDIVQQQVAKDVVIVPLLFDLYGNIHTADVSGLPRPRSNSLGLISLAGVYFVAS